MSVQLHYYLIEIDPNTSLSVIAGPLKLGPPGSTVITNPSGEPLFSMPSNKVKEIDRARFTELLTEEVRRSKKPLKPF